MLVAAVLIIGLLVMSLLISAYQAHAMFLRTRSIVARETVGAITADFNRALATILALATLSYYDSNRFSDFTSRFEVFGLKPRDLESVKQVASQYLNAWINLQRVVYAEQGIQVSWHPSVCDVSNLIGQPAYVFDLFLINWNGTVAGSYTCAQLQLNLTNVGFYHWKSNTLIGLTMKIENAVALIVREKGKEREICDVNITLLLQLTKDNGVFYGLLLMRGSIEVYHLDGSGRGQKLTILDATYKGFGSYDFTLAPINEMDIKDGDKVLVVVSDDRGILVLGQAPLKIEETTVARCAKS